MTFRIDHLLDFSLSCFVSICAAADSFQFLLRSNFKIMCYKPLFSALVMSIYHRFSLIRDPLVLKKNSDIFLNFPSNLVGEGAPH